MKRDIAGSPGCTPSRRQQYADSEMAVITSVADKDWLRRNQRQTCTSVGFKMFPPRWDFKKAGEGLWLELHAGEIKPGNSKLSLHYGKSTSVSQSKFLIKTEVVIKNYRWQLNKSIAIIQSDYVSSMQESTQVEGDSLLQRNCAQSWGPTNVTIMQTPATSIILEPGNWHITENTLLDKQAHAPAKTGQLCIICMTAYKQN